MAYPEKRNPRFRQMSSGIRTPSQCSLMDLRRSSTAPTRPPRNDCFRIGDPGINAEMLDRGWELLQAMKNFI